MTQFVDINGMTYKVGINQNWHITGVNRQILSQPVLTPTDKPNEISDEKKNEQRKMCKIIVEIDMALEGNSTPEQAEDSIIDWMDRMMLYQIGYNEVADTKRPYVFDYDIKEVDE